MGKSARKKPRLPKANPKSEEEPKFESALIILSSSDDEADEDLSLKIVEKAMLRSFANEAPNTNLSPPATEVKKQIKKRRQKKKENMVEDVEPKKESGAPKEDDATTETNPSEKSDNAVLRKLLRGPRYFDPPDSSWGNCYNCGEGGHLAVNCTSAKRRKPCFVCGSLEHNAKQCNKGKDCFICKKGGHRAKDCPEKSNWGGQIAKICLKCGDSGHEMFTCKSKYSPDDLKEIQCYVCKCFGHLCCVNYAGEGPREVSCYRCGQLDHSGWECARVHAERTSNGTPNSCYKCGEEGHMARKCTISNGTPSSVKKNKWKSEFSSPRKSRSRDNYGNHVGVRSVPPHDLGNARKRSKTQYGQQQPTSSQQKPTRGRGGWITQDPGDYNNNSNHGYGGSPKTPARYKSNDRFRGGNSGYKSNDSRFHSGNSSYNNNSGFHSGNSSYNNNSVFHSNRGNYQYDSTVGSNGYQQRFSASRFGNSSSYGKREYGWDY